MSIIAMIADMVVAITVTMLLAFSDVRHSPSLRDEIATEHLESTVITTPVTVILDPPLTHSSIREMSEPLSVSEVPSSLARYVTDVGDSGEQENAGLSMMSLVMSHSEHEVLSLSNTAWVMSSNLSSVREF